MKLTVLTDNHAGGHFGAEHGLSYLIENNGDKFLFDTGHSGLFLKNAQLAGISGDDIGDTVILSHGHWDHGNGLKFLDKKKLICHPGCFIKRYRKGGNENIGLNQTKQEIDQKFSLETYSGSREIFNNVFFLGEIPRINDFEAQTTAFVLENGEPDFVWDDSAIAIREGDSFSVVSGCAHSGIVNIVEYAQKITGGKKLKLVIGGFHLKLQNQQCKKTIEYFKNNKPEILIPSHCTDLPALAAFHQEFNTPFLKTGQIINS